MFLAQVLIVTLLVNHVITSDIFDSRVYFKTLLVDKGYFLGKAKNEFTFEGQLKITFEELIYYYESGEEIIPLRILISNNDGTVQNKTYCEDYAQNSCLIDVSQIPAGYFEVSLQNKFGERYSLYSQEYADKKFLFASKSCKLTSFDVTKYCICDPDEQNVENCEEAKLKNCYTITPTRKPEDVPFSTTGFAIQLDSKFDDENILATKAYVFDESSQQFYMVYWEPAPKNQNEGFYRRVQLVKSSNISTFELKVSISPTYTDTIAETRKSNFIITNFDMDTMVLFDNAYCYSTSSDNQLVCVCCKNNNADKICKKQHSNGIVFRSITHIKQYGAVILAGNAWVESDKKMYIQFEDTQLATQQLKYQIRTLTTDRKETDQGDCTNPKLNNWCPVDISNPEISVFRLVTYLDGNYIVLMQTGIYDGKLRTKDNTECQLEHPTSSMQQCVCDYVDFTGCQEVSNSNKRMTGNPIDFTVQLSEDNKILLPLQTPTTIAAKDADKTTPYDYVIKLGPVDADNVEYGIKGLYPTKIYVVETVSTNPKTTNTLTRKTFAYVPKQMILFNNAFCELPSSNQLKCTCCVAPKRSKSTKCDAATQYKFFFTNVLRQTWSFVSGSGTVWSTQKDLQMLWNQMEPHNSKAKYQLADDTTSTCDFNNVCSYSINKSTLVYSQFSVDDEHPQLTGQIPLTDNKAIDHAPNSCQKIRDLVSNAEMCICDNNTLDGLCTRTKPITCEQILTRTNQIASMEFEYDKDKLKKSLAWQTPVNLFVENDSGSEIMHLVYEPVNKFDSKVLLDSSSFRLRILATMYDVPASNKPTTIKGRWNFPTNISDIYTLDDASCHIDTDKSVMVCGCCKRVAEDICPLWSEPIYQVNAQVLAPIKDDKTDYGQFFGSLIIVYDTNKYFTLRWISTLNGFSNSATFTAQRPNGEEKPCVGSPFCYLKFDTDLKNEQITLFVLLRDSTGTTLQKTKTAILSLTIKNDKIVEPGNKECSAYNISTTPANKYCICWSSKPFDDNCNAASLKTSESIQPSNTNLVNGKQRKYTSFLVNLNTTQLNENQNYYVTNGKVYYAFRYQTKKQLKSNSINSVRPNLDESSGFITYLPYLNPTSSNQIPNADPLNKIEMNFDLNDSIVVFADATCTTSTDNKQMFCQQCMPGENECSLEKPGQSNNNNNDGGSESTTTISTSQPEIEQPYDPNKDYCKNPDQKLTYTLCKINENNNINSSNLDEKIDQMQKANIKDADDPDLKILGEIFDKFSGVQDATSTQREKLIDLFDQVLSVNDTAFDANGRKVSDGLIGSIHKIITESADDLSYLNGKNFGVQKKSLSCSDKQKWKGLGDDSKKYWDRNDGVVTDKAAILLSMDTLCKNQAKDANNSAAFMIYRNKKLFKSNKNDKNKPNRCKRTVFPTNDIVLTAVLIKKQDDVLVQLRFKKEQFNLPLHSKLAISWWDKDKWSQERQCTFKEDGPDYIGQCDHLTDFALLVDKSPTDPHLCDNTLNYLGFSLCLISLIALFVLGLIFLTRVIPIVKQSAFVQIVNNNRQSRHDSIVIVYIGCLGLFYLLFLVFIDQSTTHSNVFCKLTACFLYYLFLTSILLNVFQAWSMIKMCAWTSRIEHVLDILTRIYIALPVSLGLPLIVNLTLWFTDTRLFNRQDDFCWIHPQSIIYAVLIPVTLMLLNSFATFAIFCFRMFPDFFSRFGIRLSSVKLASAEKQQRRINFELFIVLFFAQFILGFPWILQYPAMAFPHSTVWHYLFAIFNGSNGFIIFFIYMFKRTQVFYKIRKANQLINSQQTASTATH